MDPRLEDYVEIHAPELLKQYQECLVVLQDEVVARKAWVKNLQHANKQARLWVEDLNHDEFFRSSDDFRVFIPKTNGVEPIPPGMPQLSSGNKRYSRTDDDEEAVKIKSDKNCPGGHGLQFGKVPSEDFTCDVCKYALPAQSNMFSCRICDWDSCADCAGVEEEEAYEVGEQVLVFYGPLLYDATVVEIDPEDDEPYLVHFVGWNRRHDLWVPLPNMVKLNADTRQQQKELQMMENQKQAKKKAATKKKRKTR